MKILFALTYPGFLRYFDGTIRSLADLGHEVELWFEQPDKQAEGLDAFPAHPRVTVKGALPKRRDVWAGTAIGVRGVTDYVRYLEPRFSGATYLRERAFRKLPRGWQRLGGIRSLPTGVVRVLLSLLRTVEAAIPRGPQFDRLLADSAPDVVLCAPLVMWRSRQADLVHSARAAGVPSMALIASWDNLTTKGLLRVMPDRVVVWNDLQASEAAELHRVPPERVLVTGAQPFDKWFGRQPTRDRATFCRRVGLKDDQPFLLFVGSTASISAPEAERDFVRRWIGAIRSSADLRVAEMPILVRPHPYNSAHWSLADVAEFSDVALYPVGGANPVDESDRSDYFDSLYHSVAVVGINTSAMVEAAVIGRPVLTITAAEFEETQSATLHFQYLLPGGGGAVLASASLAEHVGQLAGVIADPHAAAERLESFVARFVRPRGLDQPVTPILVQAIEETAKLRVVPRPEASIPVRAVIRTALLAGPLRCSGTALRRRVAWRLGRRPKPRERTLPSGTRS